MRWYGQMLQKFYCFIFPFLSPLSSFFLFSSLSLSSSLSLLPISVPSLFDQSGMFTNSDDGVAPMSTARFAGEGLEDSFLETRADLSHPLKPPPPISPNRRQYRLATLNLANLTPRPPSISPRGRRRSHPLPSPLCPPFTLPLSGCGFFLFVCLFVCCNLG